MSISDLLSQFPNDLAVPNSVSGDASPYLLEMMMPDVCSAQTRAAFFSFFLNY